MAEKPNDNITTDGFTLVELAAVIMIAMVISFGIFRLYRSMQGHAEYTATHARMQIIKDKIEQYYLSHEHLPAAGPESDETGFVKNQVPVQADALDMEQKYRFDEWGRFIVYLPGDINDIQDMDGYAAKITSAGPDQLIDPPNEKDNIEIKIDLTRAATDIVLRKLKALQAKVVAYDAMFAGLDNDGDGVIDEDAGKDPADFVEDRNNICSLTGKYDDYDPSEGLSILDKFDTLCPSIALSSRFVNFYGLKSGMPGGYDYDPWNRLFKWRGLCQDGELKCHVFYSMGTDGLDKTDDDISYFME